MEMVNSRLSLNGSEIVGKHQPVGLGADGKMQVYTTTSKAFMGICQYPNDVDDGMITSVKGIYPGVAGGAIAIGDNLTVTNGKFTKAAADADFVGVALEAGVADDLVTIYMI